MMKDLQCAVYSGYRHWARLHRADAVTYDAGSDRTGPIRNPCYMCPALMSLILWRVIMTHDWPHFGGGRMCPCHTPTWYGVDVPPT